MQTIVVNITMAGLMSNGEKVNAYHEKLVVQLEKKKEGKAYFRVFSLISEWHVPFVIWTIGWSLWS